MDLQVEHEHLKYTEHLDRGGLIYPSKSLLQVASNIFNMCVASDLERKCINVHNQRQISLPLLNSTSQLTTFYRNTLYLTGL